MKTPHYAQVYTDCTVHYAQNRKPSGTYNTYQPITFDQCRMITAEAN